MHDDELTNLLVSICVVVIAVAVSHRTVEEKLNKKTNFFSVLAVSSMICIKELTTTFDTDQVNCSRKTRKFRT